MLPTVALFPLFFFIATGNGVLQQIDTNQQRSAYISEDTIDQRQNAIRVFEFDRVDKAHACSLIRCSEEDVCAVLDNVALCIERQKAKRIILDATESKKHNSPIEIFGEKPELKKKQRPSNFHRSSFKLDQLEELNNQLHRKHVENYDQPCTDKQLVTVEDLLANWFSALHKQSINADTIPLSQHHLRCRPDVGWMFTQLDTNRDGQLEHNELYALDHKKYENCIHHFLDQCDLNQDGQLSVDEWCDCFEWAGREREEPPCHAARRLIDPHVLGSFIPRCDPEGFYRPEQCHGLQCWCADKWGREFDHSRTSGHADCGQYAEEENGSDEQ